MHLFCSPSWNLARLSRKSIPRGIIYICKKFKSAFLQYCADTYHRGGDNLWNRYLGNLWTSCMATCGVSSSATCGNSTGCRVCQMISDALGNMWNDSTGCRGWNIHNLTHFHPFSSDQMTRNLSMKKWGLDFCSTRLLCDSQQSGWTEVQTSLFHA